MTDLPEILRTDQSESPERTKELGDIFAESVRAMNYATLGDAPGLEYPGDVDRLLGAIYTGTGRLPQLLTQLTSFLRAQRDTGLLADDHGRDATGQVAMAACALGGAHGLAMRLTEALQQAQNVVAGLYVKEDRDG